MVTDVEFLDKFEDFVEEKRGEVLHKYSENENIMLVQTLIDRLRAEQEQLLHNLEGEEDADV